MMPHIVFLPRSATACSYVRSSGMMKTIEDIKLGSLALEKRHTDEICGKTEWVNVVPEILEWYEVLSCVVIYFDDYVY